MTLGVTPKLFLAVLFTNVITAVAVGLGVRAAFVRSPPAAANDNEPVYEAVA